MLQVLIVRDGGASKIPRQVADMEAVGGGIGEHVQAVEFLAGAGQIRGLEDGVLGPAGLPLGLDLGPGDAFGSHAGIISFETARDGCLVFFAVPRAIIGFRVAEVYDVFGGFRYDHRAISL